MAQLINTTEGRTLAKTLYQRAHDYFQSEEHRRAFRKWYKRTYGKEYVEKEYRTNGTRGGGLNVKH